MSTKKPLLTLTPLVIQHIIDWVIKLATMVITIPATWTVASLVYDSRLDGFPLLLVKIAAVSVVDLVFLASIWIIEGRKGISDSEKIVNATIVWVLYFMLLFIAFENGEGLQGIIFRVAIAIYLARITQSTLAASFRRSEKEEQAGEGSSVKWLARILSFFLVMRQMISEYAVKMKLLAARQISDSAAIKENKDNLDMLAKDRMFLYLFERPSEEKQHLALAGPGAMNSNGEHFYDIKRTPDGQYQGECPICHEKRHGETPYTVILLLNGHVKEHPDVKVKGKTPLEELTYEPEETPPPDFS